MVLKEKTKGILKLVGKIFTILVVPILFFSLIGDNPTKQVERASRTIAVVNEDLGEEENGQVISFGQELSAVLGKDSEYDYIVVNRNSAERGLEQRQYDAVIYLGSDFTKNLLSFEDANPVKAMVRFEIQANLDAKNREKVQKELERMKNEINKEITTLYWSYVSSEIEKIRQHFDQIVEKEVAFQESVSSFYLDSSSDLSTEINQQRNQLESLISSLEGISQTADGSVESAESAAEQMKAFAELLADYKEYQREQREMIIKKQEENKELIKEGIEQYRSILTAGGSDIKIIGDSRDPGEEWAYPDFSEEKDLLNKNYTQLIDGISEKSKFLWESWTGEIPTETEKLIALHEELLQYFNSRADDIMFNYLEEQMSILKKGEDTEDPGEPGEPGDPVDPEEPGNPEDPGNPDDPGNKEIPSLPPNSNDVAIRTYSLASDNPPANEDENPDSDENSEAYCSDEDNGDVDQTIANLVEQIKELLNEIQDEEFNREEVDHLLNQIVLHHQSSMLEKDEIIVSLCSTIEILNATIDNLEQEKAELAEKIEELQSKIDELNNRIDELEKENARLEQENQELKNQLADKEKEIENLKAELEAKEEQIKQLEEQVQNLTERIAELLQIVADAIETKEENILNHPNLPEERKDNLKEIFDLEMDTEDLQFMIDYFAYLATYENILEKLKETGSDLIHEVMDMDSWKEKIDEILAISEIELETYEELISTLEDEDGLASVYFNLFETFYLDLITGFTEFIDNEYDYILTVLTQVEEETEEVTTNLLAVNEDLPVVQETEIAERLDGQYAVDLHDSALQNLRNISSQLANIYERNESVNTYTIEMQNKVLSVQSGANQLSQNWSENVNFTERVKEDVYQVLNNAIVDGQSNTYVYDYLANPITLSGQTPEEPVVQTPPVVMLVIIILSGILIGYFSNFYSNAPLAVQLALFLLLNIAVGLIIGIYGLNIYTMHEAQALKWSLLTIVLLFAISSIIKAGFTGGGFVGLVVSSIMMVYFVIPLLDLVLPSFSFKHHIANLYTAIQYDGNQSAFIPIVSILILLTILVLGIEIFLKKRPIKEDEEASEM